MNAKKTQRTRKKPKSLLYMHTINGKAAHYCRGQQIVFAASHWRYPVKLVATIEQIQAEQRASTAWRRKHCGPDDPAHPFHYGHVYVAPFKA